MLIIDTNILLDYPQIIEDEEDDILIITDVLKELDGLKLHQNFETAFKARRAAVVISHNVDMIKWSDEMENIKKPVDDKLLDVAEKFNGILVTNDVYLKVKAHIRGIETHGYGNSEVYNGVRTILIATDNAESNSMLGQMMCGEIPDKLKEVNENEYIIVKDMKDCFLNKHGEQDFKTIAHFVCRDEKLHYLYNYGKLKIHNSCINEIVPRNAEQTCLFDALLNRNNTIIYAGGRFGTGKSFILNNFALQELETGRIKRIIYVPNNSYTENTFEIGILPGELLDKIVGQIGPLIDLIGIDQVNRLIQTDSLEITPVSSIRGRSFTDSIVIVNEAQNLTEEHIKLLIARIGEGSRIFFDGDYKQTDSAIFRNKNGLKLLLKLARSPIYAKLFAAIKLETTERSQTAQAAAYLDFLTGGI